MRRFWFYKPRFITFCRHRPTHLEAGVVGLEIDSKFRKKIQNEWTAFKTCVQLWDY